MASPRLTRVLGVVALTGAAVWVITIAAFHAIRPDLDPGNAYISNYARGDWAWVMRLAFAVNGAGWIAAGLGLRRALPATRARSWLTALTVTGGAAIIVAGAFRADPLGSATHSLEATIHGRAAAVAFVTLTLAGFAGWRAARTADAWRGWAVPSLAYGVVAATLLITYVAWPVVADDGFGWWQRALAWATIPGALAAVGTGLVSGRGSGPGVR
ncbi:DUF998 domain-containing protein [Demequina activiva]|nr:DUF998 domain-containing protein [Demequina activiva]